jgi:hypothetical protein
LETAKLGFGGMTVKLFALDGKNWRGPERWDVEGNEYDNTCFGVSLDLSASIALQGFISTVCLTVSVRRERAERQTEQTVEWLGDDRVGMTSKAPG